MGSRMRMGPTSRTLPWISLPLQKWFTNQSQALAMAWTCWGLWYSLRLWVCYNHAGPGQVHNNLHSATLGDWALNLFRFGGGCWYPEVLFTIYFCLNKKFQGKQEMILVTTDSSVFIVLDHIFPLLSLFCFCVLLCSFSLLISPSLSILFVLQLC